MAEQTAFPACAFRRVTAGQTVCTAATDEFDQPVWRDSCLQCPVPGWLEAGICAHLDVGTEVGRMFGVDKPRVYTSCHFYSVRLDGLQRCQGCPEFSPWAGPSEAQVPIATQEIAAAVPRVVLERAMREAVDRKMDRETVRTMLQCFRTGVQGCLRNPMPEPNWVLVVPPPSLRGVEGFRALVADILQRGGAEGLFFLGTLKDVDALCDLCVSIQRCAHVVIDLSEWDPAALFSLGLAGALNRSLLLLRQRDSTPPFVPQGFSVFECSTGEELAMALVQGLGLQLQPVVQEGQPAAVTEGQTPETPVEAAPKTRVKKTSGKEAKES